MYNIRPSDVIFQPKKQGFDSEHYMKLSVIQPEPIKWPHSSELIHE
jgi:hypothetical protein